jgi:hypothetical protein
MSTGQPDRTVLACEEADRRKVALAGLQEALAALGVDSVLAGRRTLTLRGSGPASTARVGDPELHVRGAGHSRVVTTDGQYYSFADGGTHPVGDPSGAAGRILSDCVPSGSTRSQPLAPPDQRDGGRDGMGAGERALRRLYDEGVI